MPNTTETLSDADIQALARLYRFSPDVRAARGRTGRRQGKETGASVEIQDFRDYVPGDDPRHIDWMAYGRTDRLMIRLYREEVSPYVDLIVDSSPSMSLADGRKAALRHELCAYLYHSARAEGTGIRLFSAGDDMRRVADPYQFDGSAGRSVLFSDPRAAAAGLRRSAIRIVLSDFMDPADPRVVLRTLSEGCVELIILQLLGPWEADPDPTGPSVLENCEDHQRVDVQLDADRVAAYRKRLGALLETVEDETIRCGGLYLKLIADRPLEAILQNVLLPAELISLAG